MFNRVTLSVAVVFALALGSSFLFQGDARIIVPIIVVVCGMLLIWVLGSMKKW